MTWEEAAAAAAEILSRSSKLLLCTAAGMSAESGIPVYRKPGSTNWQNYGAYEALGRKAEDLACPRAFIEEPEAGWGMIEWKRRLIAESQPHEGYAALHALGERREAFIQTTNVDGFHRRLGWPAERLHEMHGSVWELQCCGTWWEDERVPWLDVDERLQALTLPECPRCGLRPRPHMLMFADLEYLGDFEAEEARRAFLQDGVDAVLIVGESGAIPTHAYEAKQLQARCGAKIINVNPDPGSRANLFADVSIRAGAKDALTRLLQLVAPDRPPPAPR